MAVCYYHITYTSFRVNPHSIVSLYVKELLVRSRLQFQIRCLLRSRSSLTFRQTIECGFTQKLVRDMIITYSQMHKTSSLSLLIWLLSSRCGIWYPSNLNFLVGKEKGIWIQLQRKRQKLTCN